MESSSNDESEFSNNRVVHSLSDNERIPCAEVLCEESTRAGSDSSPQAGEGNKFDQGKPRIELIPRSALLEEAAVLTFGAQKYDDDNWRGGMAWRRLIGAALRHTLAFADGEDLDPESGLSHLAHARCCLGFLIEYTSTHTELDDRYEV